MEFSDGISVSLVPILFVVFAIAAAWALFTHRRRLGSVLTAIGVLLILYAVWWTVIPE